MSLRDKLEQKRQETQAEEAGRRRQEQAAREASEQAAAAERARQEAEIKKAEELHVADLSRQINELRSRRQELEKFLAELEAESAGIVKAKQSVRGKRKPVQDTREFYRDVLEKEGIASTRDLVRSEEYQKEPEVQAYQESKQALAQEVQSAKKRRREILSEVAPESVVASDRTPRKDAVVEAVQRRMVELDEEIKKLHEQTPEGRAEKLAMVKEAVNKRHQHQNSYSILERLPDFRLAGQRDTAAASEYGEEFVQEAIISHYAGRVDNEVAREKKEKGLEPLATDLKKLEAYPAQRVEVVKAVQDMERKRADLVVEISRMLEQSPDKLERLKGYYRHGFSSVDKAAEDYVEHLIDLAGQRIAFSGKQAYENLVAGGSSDTQARIEGMFREGKVGQYWDNRGQRGDLVRTKLSDPQYLLDMARQFSAFLENISRHIQTSDKFPPEFEDISVAMSADRIKRDAETQLVISSQTAQEINRVLARPDYHDLVRKTRAGVERMESAGQKIKDLLPLKLEADWKEQKLREFDHEHKADTVEREYLSLVEAKKISQEARPLVAAAMINHQDHGDERIRIAHTGYGGRGYIVESQTAADESSEYHRQISEPKKELEALNRQVADKKAEGRPKLFPGKYNAALTRLERDRDSKQAEVRRLESDYVVKTSRRKSLSDVKKIVDLVRNQKEGIFRLSDFLEQVKSDLEQAAQEEFSPDKQIIYDQRQELKLEVETAKKKFQAVQA